MMVDINLMKRPLVLRGTKAVRLRAGRV